MGLNMFLTKMFGVLISEFFRLTANNILPSFPAAKKRALFRYQKN
jgi:hypothetical protein